MKIRLIIDLDLAVDHLSDAAIMDAVEQNTYQYAVTSHLADALKWSVESRAKRCPDAAASIVEVHQNWADWISKADKQIILRHE